MEKLTDPLYCKFIAKQEAERLQLLKRKDPLRLDGCGYKIYSQTDEDGIIQEIFNRIGTKSKIFFEFGVGAGTENNTRALLQLFNWSGAWIECNEKKLKGIQANFKGFIKAGRLTTSSDFIYKENINDIAKKLGLPENIDLLSIDIDGNDYHIWDSIDYVKPRVVVIEYSAKFGPDAKIVQPYSPDYQYDAKTHIGASWKALVDLATQKGYRAVGTGISGLNAYFVKEDEACGRFVDKNEWRNIFNPARLELYYLGGFRNE